MRSANAANGRPQLATKNKNSLNLGLKVEKFLVHFIHTWSPKVLFRIASCYCEKQKLINESSNINVSQIKYLFKISYRALEKKKRKKKHV